MPLQPERLSSSRTLLTVLGSAALLFIVVGWRLGGASFWDPDEAHYAQATRELLATGDWLAPFYNGQPFFDKPILFYWLQALPMSLAPQSEAAARLAPAIAGILLVLATAWVGTRLLGRAVGVTAALMLAVNPGVFALARYAILDLPFALFLFTGVGAVAVAAVNRQRNVEYAGYVMIGLANATKGPVALILCGLTFVLACVVSADARRELLRLRWIQGMVIAIALGLPWPLYMLWRFGRAFVDGYILNENIRLFATPMYSGQPGWSFYLTIVLLGMLPWTGMVIARIAELARRRNGGTGRPDLVDVLLWSWVTAIVGFFSFSHFKLDHYVFPASPALCLICARAWHDLRSGSTTPAATWGVRLIGPTLIVAGGAIAFASMSLLDLDRGFLVVPAALLIAGAAASRYGWRDHLPEVPVAPILAMAIVYAGAVAWVIPKLEEGKVVPDVAQWVRTHARPGDRIATFRLNRWNTAYRFYVERPVTVVESDEEAREFFANPGPYFCVMTGRLYDALRSAGVPMQIAYEREGRWVTSGRALWRRNGERSTRFIVAVPGHEGGGH